jgi:hypothetical protein
MIPHFSLLICAKMGNIQRKNCSCFEGEHDEDKSFGSTNRPMRGDGESLMLHLSKSSVKALIFLFVSVCSAFTQEKFQPFRVSTPDTVLSLSGSSNSRNPVWNPLIFASSTIAGGAAIHFGRYVPLWSSYKTSFFSREDYRYALSQDKLLHVFGASFGSKLGTDLYELSGMPRGQAQIYGSAASLLLMSFVELEDGSISYLGFDKADFGADVVGAVYPIAQEYLPLLRSFTPKASYHGSGRNVSVSGQMLSGPLSDHEGQTFWIGITVGDLLPAGWRRYWPSILGVALGRGVRDLSTDHASSYLLVALDLDLRKLPSPAPWVQQVWDALNYIHLPMPAVRISHGTVWYGLYF